MINAIFYCDIYTDGEDEVEEDFAFDRGTFDNKEALEKYIKNCGYEIGEPCAYWGDDVGILKEILIDDED